MTYSRVALFLFVIFANTRALAGFTDFEDLAVGTIFTPGQTIQSKGLAFEILDGNPSSRVNVRTVRVEEFLGFITGAGGSGLELSLGLPQPGRLNFVLPPETRHVSMLFGAADPGGGFVVNGIATPLAGDFAGLDGSILGGVSVTIIPSPTPPFGDPDRQGTLVLTGPIDSLLLFGTELSIDDVRIAIPEPTAFFLVGAAVFFVLGARRVPRLA